MASSPAFDLKKAAAMALFAVIVIACLFLVLGQSSASAKGEVSVSPSGKWTCSMDPQFVLSEPGKCPKCFMDLIPLAEGARVGGKRELVLSREAAEIAGIHSDVAVRADGEDEERPVTVPAAAILHNLGRSFVFVETDSGDDLSFIMREIATGSRDGERRAVLEGVDEGEMVAVSGLFRIDSAMQILGKVSLVNLPDGDLASVDDTGPPPFQPAERSKLDLRRQGGLAVDEWFKDYELVRAALAKDDYAAASGPALRLSEALGRRTASPPEEFASLHTALSRDADALAEAPGLEPIRGAFEKVSADMVLLARRYGPPAGGLNLIFCPMAFDGKGAHWLQPDATVDNPFHGLEMPRCGWLVENIGDGAKTDK